MLFARRGEKLDAESDNLRERYGISINTCALDLAAPELEMRLVQNLATSPPHVLTNELGSKIGQI